MQKSTLLLSFVVLIFSSCKSVQQKNIQVVTLAKSSKSWGGKLLPEYPSEHPEVTIIKVTIPGKTKLDWHKHPNINAGVLLKGELTVISEYNDTLRLKKGDPIVELVNTWHYGVNEKNRPAEIVVFYAGTKDSLLSIKRK
ncbi:cupin domain-containing protein [Flagellimonas sp.]|uniref:cupin domain-containing protein n=1 Tax=Flagellimonas sp. TaxID=2058762 RepID=UPI003B5BB1B8